MGGAERINNGHREEIKKACSTYVLKCHNEADYSMNTLQQKWEKYFLKTSYAQFSYVN